MGNPLEDGLNKPDQVSVNSQIVDGGATKATDVAVVVTFNKTFVSTPTVCIGLGESGAAATQPGMVIAANAGSFSFLGTSGLTHNWNAIGSGNL